MEALTVKNLSFKYPAAPSRALNDVSLSVSEGEFVLLCGGTGCGKTTFLRLIKASLAPHGEKLGDIAVFGKDPRAMSIFEEATSVGMVMQRPESQIVSENVIDELAFGLSNLGIDNSLIHRRTAEVSGYFGIDHWAEKPIASLSGGQKQIINLASVIAMRPKLLLLDEPTSRLDPISAAEFISAVTRLNRETGITVIMAEHRLESAFPVCDRVVFMRDGGIEVDSPPRAAAKIMASSENGIGFLPPPTKIFALGGRSDDLPLTVREARELIGEAELVSGDGGVPELLQTETLLEAKDLFFRYEKNSKDVIKGAGISVSRGEILCLMGGNAAGKSTLLKCLAGLLKPYDGSVKISGRKLRDMSKSELYAKTVAYLPQDVNAVFSCATVAEELAAVGISKQDIPLSLEPLAGMHPYDLSGGEQQKCALAKITAKKPEIILLDEPTKGLDPQSVKELAAAVKAFSYSGAAVICVTHDSEFAASIADSVVLMFGGVCGEKVSPLEFFVGNSFYTTAAARIAKGHSETIFRSEQLSKALRKAAGIG